jgi:hypothetical protein
LVTCRAWARTNVSLERLPSITLASLPPGPFSARSRRSRSRPAPSLASAIREPQRLYFRECHQRIREVTSISVTGLTTNRLSGVSPWRCTAISLVVAGPHARAHRGSQAPGGTNRSPSARACVNHELADAIAESLAGTRARQAIAERCSTPLGIGRRALRVCTRDSGASRATGRKPVSASRGSAGRIGIPLATASALSRAPSTTPSGPRGRVQVPYYREDSLGTTITQGLPRRTPEGSKTRGPMAHLTLPSASSIFWARHWRVTSWMVPAAGPES